MIIDKLAEDRSQKEQTDRCDFEGPIKMLKAYRSFKGLELMEQARRPIDAKTGEVDVTAADQADDVEGIDG